MPLSWQIALAFVAIVALIRSARRARELCVLSVRNGKALRMRGKLPGEARAAISDVLARGRVARGTIRVLRGAPRAELDLTGIDPETAQRLRNVIATFSAARLATGQVAHHRNIGQRLGIAWLAWWLEDRARN